MINFATDGDAVKRTTGIVAATSNYTCVFWWRATATITDDRIIFLTVDSIGAYDDYAYIVSGGAGFIHLAIGHNGGEESTTSVPIVVNTFYPIAYVREGSTHRFYFNGGLIGSVTEDISDATFGETWLGSDSVTTNAQQNFYYFREWSRALSESELYTEFTHTSAQSTVLLATDTPLESDLLDDSGNGHTWTAVGSNSFVGTPPIYVTKYTALDLGFPPFTGTLNANNSDNTETFKVWVRFEALVNIRVVGAFGYGGASYKPFCNVQDINDNFVINEHDAGDGNLPVQFPVISGDIYFLSFGPNGNFNPANIDLSILNHTRQPVPIGTYAIPDDRIPSLFLTFVSPNTDNTVLDFINFFPPGEAGDTLRNGIVLVEDKDANNLKLYNSAFTLLQTIAYTGTPNIRTNHGSQKFYVANGIGIVKTVLEDGSFGPITWDLGTSTFRGIAASNDDAVLYYAATTASAPLLAWDLVNNVSLGTFVTGLTNYRIGDILVMPTNSIVVLYYRTLPFVIDVTVKQYNALGALINSYEFGTDNSFPSGTFPRLAYALDPNRFIVWRHLDSINGMTEISECDLDGNVLSTVQHIEYEAGLYNGDETATPLGRFGPPFSCPIFVLQATTFPVATPYSGIYKLVPGKRNDTVWLDVNAQETLNIKIPDPFIKTGMFGS